MEVDTSSDGPPAVTGLTVTLAAVGQSSYRFTAAWTAPANPDPPITGYDVVWVSSRVPGGQVTVQAGAAATQSSTVRATGPGPAPTGVCLVVPYAGRVHGRLESERF